MQQQQPQQQSDVFHHVDWNRVIGKAIPFSIVGGVSGFIFATATARPTVLTPALWSGYAALSSGAFFALRDWFFTPSGIDNLDKLPVWKQLSVRVLCCAVCPPPFFFHSRPRSHGPLLLIHSATNIRLHSYLERQPAPSSVRSPAAALAPSQRPLCSAGSLRAAFTA